MPLPPASTPVPPASTPADTATEGVQPGGRGVQRSVLIAADPAEVWRVMFAPETAPGWMGGFRVASSWEVGGPFALHGMVNGAAHEDAGTLLACEPGKLLRYAHWSGLWRVPDTPENHAVMTFRLDPEGDATRVSITHDLPVVLAIAQHSDFFWRVGLEQLRRLVEG